MSSSEVSSQWGTSGPAGICSWGLLSAERFFYVTVFDVQQLVGGVLLSNGRG